MKKSLFLALFLTGLYVLSSGCNSARRTARQEAKNRNTTLLFLAGHREEFARLCDENFPVEETVIRGDTVKGTPDTVFTPGVMIDCPPADTPRKVHCPPGRTVTIDHYITDTVIRENTAKAERYRLESERLKHERDSVSFALRSAKADRDQWKATAKKRWWIIVGGGAGLAALLAVGLYLKLKPKML